MARKWGTDVKGVPPCRANIVVADNDFHSRTIGIIGFFSDEITRGGFGRRRRLCPADWTTPCAMVTSDPALLAATKIGGDTA